MVIDKTFAIPRNVVSYRKGLPENLVTQIKEILIRMDTSEEGRKVLLEFEATNKFDEITPASSGRLVRIGKWAATELELK